MRSFLRALVFYQLLSVALTVVFQGAAGFWKTLPAFWLVTNCISLSIHGLFLLLARRFGYLKWRRWRQLALGAPVVAAGCLIGIGIASPILQLFTGKALLTGRRFIIDYRGTLLVAALVTTLILGYHILQDRIATEALEAERLRGLKARAELAALRARLDPHFLFNTLNTMLDLVHSEPDKVEEMILGLADIYRRVLKLPDTGTIALAEEFALAEQYLRIESVRMGDRLHYALELPPELGSVRISPLLVQPLIENAMVHGIGPRPKGGCLRLAARKEEDVIRIEVCDDGVGLPDGGRAGPGRAGSGHTGFGLHSVRERLRLHYGPSGSLSLRPASGGGTCATLVIPVNSGAGSSGESSNGHPR